MNGIICINKPQDMTSFDVVKRVRRETRAKVGHSGTLDPMASGVLIVALNSATKALPFLDVADKTYHAKLKLGLKTHTGDIWGDVLEEETYTPVSEDAVRATLQSLIGPLNQRVPKVSAKKVDGKRSYDYVFQGEEVKQLYTDIEIYDIEFLGLEGDTIEFIAKVSNGTYIRTLCEDIAEGLGNIGTMSYLCRTQVGSFTLEDCSELDEPFKILDVKEHMRIKTIHNPNLVHFVKNGKRIKLNIPEDEVLVDTGEYFAVYQREVDDTFKSLRGLW